MDESICFTFSSRCRTYEMLGVRFYGCGGIRLDKRVGGGLACGWCGRVAVTLRGMLRALLELPVESGEDRDVREVVGRSVGESFWSEEFCRVGGVAGGVVDIVGLGCHCKGGLWRLDSRVRFGDECGWCAECAGGCCGHIWGVCNVGDGDWDGSGIVGNWTFGLDWWGRTICLISCGGRLVFEDLTVRVGVEDSGSGMDVCLVNVLRGWCIAGKGAEVAFGLYGGLLDGRGVPLPLCTIGHGFGVLWILASRILEDLGVWAVCGGWEDTGPVGVWLFGVLDRGELGCSGGQVKFLVSGVGAVLLAINRKEEPRGKVGVNDFVEMVTWPEKRSWV
ncbi:hypothetical protein Tco_0364577 [Tanacetum coccineum]